VVYGHPFWPPTLATTPVKVCCRHLAISRFVATVDRWE